MIPSLLLTTVATAILLGQERFEDSRLHNATTALREVMHSPDRGIPHDLLEKSQCIVVIPDLLKAAFVVGGKYGRGFASCRHAGGWSSPAAVRIEGGSLGFQLGGSSTDLIMLVMNRNGMNRLLGDKFTIGGDAAAAAGPVGRETSAQTDVAMHAEILTWSRSRGLFAGISLDGATLRPDHGENKKLYGREISNREILDRGVPMPAVARDFVATIARYSREPNAPVEARVHRRDRDDEPSAALNAPGGRMMLGENEVHFATGQSAVPPDAEPALGKLARTLTEHPDWRIRIEGYTDNVGNRAANWRLSQDRAGAVLGWLADHGVDRNRMSAKGRGESRPLGDNSTADGRARNRRVEIVRTDAIKTGE